MSHLQRRPVQSKPYNAETPMSVLAQPLTPDGLFYVRSHFAVPTIDPSEWHLLLDLQPGHRDPIQLTLTDLQSLPHHSVTVTLECAGNGRTTLDPAPPGTPWAFGAVSTAVFTGTPVRSLLNTMALGDDVVELLFLGADSGQIPGGEIIHFGRSLTPDVALDYDTILAWALNGRPLPPEHGAPLRLIVPRWYGVASVKWLGEIRAMSEPYEGYYQTNQYLYNGQNGVDDGTPVTTMRVRAVIATPADGDTLPLGPLAVTGTAWSGDAPISRVEVSVDNGESWQTAELEQPPSPYSALSWRLPWNPAESGTYAIMARATDGAGNTQPLEPVWTEQGYGNNAVQQVGVVVV